MALDVHIVSHTHWDREWYHPFERFRQRLVPLIDELLDDPPAGGASFLLDGQAILIEDYTSVRPERAEELASLLRAGSLEAGPWYVLADELIPSGEAIVRNLLAGRRVLRRIGASPPPVLYCPDSFGHPAALPDVAYGFGLPLVVLWRGYGGPRWPKRDTVRWQGVDGDSVVLYHLPRDGYEYGSHLPIDDTAAAERWQRMRSELVPRSVSGVILIPHGADHHARQRRWRDALDAIERAGAADAVHRSTLRDVAGQLVERTAAEQLPVVRGELRDSYGYTWTLQGTFATRAHEKRMNATAERMLLREVEPWAALAARAGKSSRPLVEAAWRDLLMAHPHDTLCGCSVDDVALAMEARLRAVHVQARGLRADAIADLIGHDTVAARETLDRWTPVVVVRNAAPRPRSGVALIDVEEFVAHVAVGPGSAPRDAAPAAPPRGKPRIGGLGTVQMLSEEMRNARTESPRHYPDNDLVSVRRVAAWITDAPPYGITTHPLGGLVARVSPPDSVAVTAYSLRNSQLLVGVDEVGRVAIEHAASGRAISDALSFVDERDVGDLYTPAPRARDYVVEFRGVKPVHRGPLRGELELRYRMRGPLRRLPDVDLSLRLTLDAGAAFVRVALRGENHATDHRTRVQFRGDIVDPIVWADAAFSPVRREPLAIGEAEAAVEHAQPTAPLHRYVSLFDDARGVSVFSDGVAEYEATRKGEVLVTVLRAVGELSKNDLPERPGHAGWPTPTPGAQCLGPFEASFGIMLHGPRTPDTIDEIELTADDVLLPLAGSTLRSAIEPSAITPGPHLVGDGLAFSAMKESEDGQWLVLRCVNRREGEGRGTWRLPFAVREAHLARLDETLIRPLEFAGNAISFRAAPGAIVTVVAK